MSRQPLICIPILLIGSFAFSQPKSGQLTGLRQSSDWTRFRGPTGTGITDDTDVPLTWGPEKNVKWRTPLPGPGNSSPIVWKNHVYITCATDEGHNRSLYCFDRSTGKQLWVRTVKFGEKSPTHQTNPYCASSPAADDERVVVWHSSAGMVCYDHDGNELWSRDLGRFIHIWGYAASPIIYKDMVINNCGPGERTFLIALDKRTGSTLWKVAEPGGASGLEKKNPSDTRAPWIGAWSTPMIVHIDGQDQILLSYPYHVKAYDPDTGKVLWYLRGLGDLVYTSVVVGDGVAVAMGGFHGPAMGFALGGTGNVTEQNRLWHATSRNPQRIGSGVILGKYMFMANAGPGTIECLDVQTGKNTWRTRMRGGNAWGSIVMAAGRLYVTNQSGETVVFAPNPNKYEQLAINSLGEPSNSTPAISDGQVFLRTFNALWCVRDE